VYFCSVKEGHVAAAIVVRALNIAAGIAAVTGFGALMLREGLLGGLLLLSGVALYYQALLAQTLLKKQPRTR
jgi:hypothetical protein